MILTAIITVIGAYLLGSVNFAVIFSRAFSNIDVRNYGSGNAGTTNVMRVGGVLPGILTFACDALKGAVASLIGKMIFEYIFTQTGSEIYLPVYGAYICGLFCIIGHIFPIYFDFKGGKGVATGVGIFAVCCPIAILCGVAVFAVAILISHIVSLSSILASVVTVIFSFVFHNDTAAFAPQAIIAALMGIIVIFKHRENIKRILNGNEKSIVIRR